MNRINQTLQNKKDKILSIYFTAGHPAPNTTSSIIRSLEKNDVNMIEIGMPFSDPLADGPTIQRSSEFALEQGMTLKKLLAELKNIRESVNIPLLLMGYFNMVQKYGVERFCEDISTIGIDGVILPDMPLEYYEANYKATFEKHNIIPIFLITPQTSEKRIQQTERLSKGFIYMVSTAATTGAQSGYSAETIAYFKRIHDMHLSVPTITGFGISNKKTLAQASQYSAGGIIGSAFVKAIDGSQDLEGDIAKFITTLK